MTVGDVSRPRVTELMRMTAMINRSHALEERIVFSLSAMVLVPAKSAGRKAEGTKRVKGFQAATLALDAPFLGRI
jgi:hypothetical protein